jgi:hypothetical protein
MSKNAPSAFSDKIIIDALELEISTALLESKRSSPSALSSALAALRDVKEASLVDARLAIFADSSSRAIGIKWLQGQIKMDSVSDEEKTRNLTQSNKLSGVNRDTSTLLNGIDNDKSGSSSSGYIVTPEITKRSELFLWLAIAQIEDGQYTSARSTLSTALMIDPGNERLGAMLELYKAKVRKEGPAGLTLVIVGTVTVLFVSAVVLFYATRGKTSQIGQGGGGGGGGGGGVGGGLKRRR